MQKVYAHIHIHTQSFFINLKYTQFSPFVLHSIICITPFAIKIYLNAFSVVIKIFYSFKLSIHALNSSIIIHLTPVYFLSPCFSIDSFMALYP